MTDTARAKSTGSASGLADLLQLVSFQLAGEEYGLEILRVQEIIRMVEITRIPHAPDFIEGVINLRGQVIPVIGLRRRFGMNSHPYDKETRIVVLEIHGSIVGFVVDAVSEVLRIPTETVEKPPRLTRSEREYVSGVGKVGNRLLLMLNADKLISAAEQSAVNQVQA